MAIKAKILKIFGVIWIGCASIPIIISLPHIIKSQWENGFFNTSGLAALFLLSPGFYALWWKDQLSGTKIQEIKLFAGLIGLTAIVAVIVWVDVETSQSKNSAKEIDEYSAVEVEAADGKMSCHYASNWFIQHSGLCDQFIPPSKIVLGETFKADGKTYTIGAISALRTKKTDDDILDLNNDEWMCAAGENISDIEFDSENHTGLWITIEKCHPIRLQWDETTFSTKPFPPK